MPNFNDPSYGWNAPQYDPSQLPGVLGGMQGGAQGGPSPSSFVPFGQPSPPRVGPLSSLGLALVAGLAGGRDPQQGLAEAGQNAAYARAKVQDDAKKVAINGWLKAGAPRDVQHPATQALFAAAPDIAEKAVGAQFGGGAEPQIREDVNHVPRFVGSGKEVFPGVKPVGSDLGGLDLPQVPLTQDGTPDPTAQSEFLSKLDPNMRALVKGVADYQMDISKVTSLRGDQRQKLAQLVSQYDPSFDMTQYPARAAMRKSITSGSYSQALNSANLLIQHADALSKAADGLNNGSFTPFNWAGNELSGLTGNPAITTFETAKKAVAAEAAKVFKGTGASSEQEIQAWEQTFSSSSSPEQIKAALHTLVGDLLKSRLDTIRSQFESAMGKPARFKMLTPHSREVIQGLGLDPSSLDNPGAGEGQSAAPTGAPAAPADASGGGPVTVTLPDGRSGTIVRIR